MSIFSYAARTRSGEARSGTIEAGSKDAALEILHGKDLIVVAMEEKARRGILEFTIGKGVHYKDIVIFSRQLATLLEAQIPLVQSLRTLQTETPNREFKRIISEIIQDVSGGSALSGAFAKHPKVFSLFYVNLIKAAEEAGKFQEVFLYLADYLERSYYLTTKARNSMIYPGFILFAFIGVFSIMLTIVIPNLARIFEETGQELPIFTKIVIGISYFLRDWGFLVLIALVVGVIASWRWSHTEQGKLFFHRLEIDMPIFGVLWRKIFTVRIADNLRTLIISGIPLIRALSITSDVVGNRVYQKAIERAIEAVKQGGTISSAFEKTPEIPALMTQMVKIGETSGRLDFILGNLAKFYQRDVDSLLDNLVALIEPVLIIVLGLSVAILVSSVLLPIYNLVGSLGQ